MADEQQQKKKKKKARTETPTGVGPGVTGASGDFIEGSGGDAGIGGIGHDDEHAAAGMRPDERNRPRPQEAMGGSPTGKVTPVRMSGSQTGTVGGGGAQAVPGPAGHDTGRPGGGGIGALGGVPGGIRNVGPANDLEPGGEDVHRTRRVEDEDEDDPQG
jgi:hypothetical protein